MASSIVRWISDKKFIGTDSTNHSVVISTPAEGIGMKASDLMLVALSSCTAVDVVEILNKKRTKLTKLEIQTTGEQDDDPPWTFRKIHMKYILGGQGLSDKSITQAIELSVDKYCSVAATLRGVAEITVEFEILPED
jgi:putative redox protein